MSTLAEPVPDKTLDAARKIRRAWKPLGGKILVWILLSGGGCMMILPFLWMISSSLKTRSQVWVFPPVWIPEPIQWGNYGEALSSLPFHIYTLNTLKITIPVLLGTLLTASMCGYGFARLRFPGRDTFFMVFLSILMLPAIVTMIPVFVMFTHLGWVDTLKPLIIPPMLGGGPFNVFLFRQFFRTIPEELSDAARMDGCGELRIYWRIVIPLSRPVMATVAIFTFLANWNDFIGPLLYLQSDAKKTIALGLATFLGLYSTNWELLMAAAATVTVPALLLFLLAQRYFVEGVVLTGLQGI